MNRLDIDHGSLSLQWQHDEIDPKPHELWEALEGESALATAMTEDPPASIPTSSPPRSLPGESASSTAITLEDILAQKRSRGSNTAVSSTRSSSTIRPHWYRRWHTQNTGAMFTVGPSSSESDMSEAEDSCAIVDDMHISAEVLLDAPAKPSASPPQRPGYHHGLGYNIDMHSDSAADSASLQSNDNRTDSLQYMHFDVNSAGRQPLSTVAEEDISEPSPYDLSIEALPFEGALLGFPSQENSRVSTTGAGDQATDALPLQDGNLPPPNAQKKCNRLCAELQLQMTDSRLDDSDSSWAEADDRQEWYIQLQTQLAAFRKQNSRLTLITSMLNTSQRKQVHAMAKMMGLSHLSLGKGKLKRLLLAKCELVQTFTSMPPNRRWTSHRQHWVPGWADPRLVVVENIRWDVPQTDVQSHITKSLALRNLPGACQFLVIQQEHVGTYAAYMFFTTPEDAASAVLALDDDRPGWNEWPLGCEYVRLPGTSRVIDGHADLNKLARAASYLWLAEQDCSDLPTLDDLPAIPRNPTSVTTPSVRHEMQDESQYPFTEYEQPTLDDMNFAAGSFADSVPMSRMLSSTSTSSDTYSSNIGQVSLGASTSITSIDSLILSDYGSEASVTKKRKRQPITQAGYKCSSAGCDKSFDRMGDLRKHEKIHSSFRPYPCGVCGQAFMYPKDLRRHQTKKGHVQLGDELARVPEESGLIRSWSTSAI